MAGKASPAHLALSGVFMLGVAATVPPTLGCAGHVPDRSPGGDISLEAGALGVDPRTELTYVLRRSPDSGRGPSLFAVSPDANEVRLVSDLTGLSDVRLLFTSSGTMILSELGATERIMLFDRDSLAFLRQRDAPGRYWGTRTSPAGRFVAVADNEALHAPIHILDASTLEVEVVPHDGDWLEAMWLNHRDQLLAVVFYGSETASPSARVLSWSAEDIASSTLWPEPTLDVTLANTTFDLLFSYTWIGVSPDDRYAVIPVQQSDASGGVLQHRLVVLDLTTFEQRVVPNAQGPVGFTADGSTIVSYRYPTGSDGGAARLLIVDAETLSVGEIDPPEDGFPNFFVTREGNWILVSLWRVDPETMEDGSTSVLYDLSTGATTVLGRHVQLGEHVSRVGSGELWLVDEEGLTRLPLMSGELEPIPLSFLPEHLNILPAHDRLVMDDAADPHAIRFFDPVRRAVSSTAVLPAY